MRRRISRWTSRLWPASWLGRVGVAAVVWSVAVTGMTIREKHRHAPAAPADRPLEMAEAGFVTSDQCRSCHPANYASWHASFHRTMTQLATVKNVLPEMDGLELSLDGWDYRVKREGDAYFVRRRPAGAGDDAFEPPRALVLLTGSHHQQNFWLATGDDRTLDPFPFGWLVAEGMWAPVPDTFLCPPEVRSGRASGTWNNGCISCHTTQGRPRFGAAGDDVGFDSRVAEFGVACEACHGEGRDHVDAHRNPLRRYLAHITPGDDPTIANPAKMSGPESALVCGQCHSIWAFSSDAALVDWNRDGAAYRPGDSELPGRFVAQPATDDHAAQKQIIRENNPHFFQDSYWADGMVRVTGREYNALELSPCFQSGAFSCLTCHEMHPERTDRATLEAWAVSQMKPGAMSDRACLQCHESIASDITAHTHHAPDSIASSCYNCHMPHSGFGLLRAVRSHQVTSPTVIESRDVGRPNACNLCHLDQPLAWTAEKLHTWYGQSEPELSRDEREIAAGALWLLRGDAGQRALVAWSMGWAPAQEAAGRDWLAPYLAITLNDSYAAVRYVAWKSLQTLPGFETFPFLYTAPDAETYAAADRAYERSIVLRPKATPLNRPATLLDASGRFRTETYNRLLDERDNRRVYLVE